MYFSTDVIVGFPGETEEDFAQTRELFEACNYDMAYIFKYSIRSGTPAADMGDQIPDEVKEARNQTLLTCCAPTPTAATPPLLGTVEEVLVEGPDKTGAHFTGRTRGNRVVRVRCRPAAGRRVGAAEDRARLHRRALRLTGARRGGILVFLFSFLFLLIPKCLPPFSIMKN
jgi:tRNA-2-methylthio-N6-dimethylallyladenosine synthase